MHVDGKVFTQEQLEAELQGLSEDRDTAVSPIIRFGICASLCHDVIPDTHRPGEYEGSSPDDVCLVKAASCMGFTFKGKKSTSLLVEVHSSGDPDIHDSLAESNITQPRKKEKEFKLLHKINFSSERKRMSVVVQVSLL